MYTVWKGQTEEEEEAQITGFSVVHGHVGYLREAYHGEPYATRYLCREAFESSSGSALLRAEVLRERLPETLRLAEERERVVYGVKRRKDMRDVLQSYRDFVALCEKKEEETGEPVMITASW